MVQQGLDANSHNANTLDQFYLNPKYKKPKLPNNGQNQKATLVACIQHLNIKCKLHNYIWPTDIGLPISNLKRHSWGSG